ncbi:tubulin binding cofactor A [Amylostereum chailletii]|nr:tubulin binding cofactor A [Amylostereum chailletii]
MSADLETTRRQLKIKSGVAKRLVKENGLYRKELVEATVKVDKLRAEGVEGWDINNATKMMQESEKMVKDASVRMGKAVGDLRDLGNRY